MGCTLLAIDTATAACSAAVYVDGRVHERLVSAGRDHSRLILEMIQTVLAEAQLSVRQLDAVAFGRGPGAFTGVRIATGVAQGIAFGADLPVVPVSTLAALAHGGRRESGAEHVLAALDARMAEVYWGAYRSEGAAWVPEGAEIIGLPAAVPVPSTGEWLGVGSGWAAHGAILGERLGARVVRVEPARVPAAWDVAVLAAADFRLGRAVPAEAALPVYLRDRVVG